MGEGGCVRGVEGGGERVLRGVSGVLRVVRSCTYKYRNLQYTPSGLF